MTSETAMALFVYLAKGTLVSALLWTYYWLFLRDRSHHLFNRIYLVSIPFVAAVLPFFRIPVQLSIWHAGQTRTGIRTLHAILPGDWKEWSGPIAGPALHSSWLNPGSAILYCCTAVSGVLLMQFLYRLLQIFRLKKRYRWISLEGVRLFMTREPAAPFSFGKDIFWDERLDLESEAGRQILRHELYHVRQRHTADLLILETVRRILWINPVFHFLHRELRMIHEFQADGYAISNPMEKAAVPDRFGYAELLVWLSMRRHADRESFLAIHSFFQSPIKRRITMITKSNRVTHRILARALVLPVSLLLFCAFALRVDMPEGVPGRPQELTVIIDPAHGGSDMGTVNRNGIAEKNISLAICQKIKELAPQFKVHVILTREDDRLPGNKETITEALHYRTEFAASKKADLFVSVHVDNIASDTSNSFSIYVSPDNTHYKQSMLLGSSLLDEMKKNFSAGGALKQRTEGIWVLSGSAMPAVLVECGNINSDSDVRFVTSADGQDKIARDILEGIAKYRGSK